MESRHFEQGTFFVGCNYWASHAGMFMWSDWDEKMVEDDLRRLSENRITTLRVFPLWSDFQPLRMHFGAQGDLREARRGEEPLDFSDTGRAGVDPVMLERFGRFCELAEQYGLKLIVGLITGWMSGRLFVPEMLQGRDPLTDPVALQWEIRFVRLMVRRFRHCPAIIAWDLGNECNCLGHLDCSEQAYVWAATISMAIRCEDDGHPIVSGMHSLSPDGQWRMQDQAEFLDVLCTHPYPIFTPHCDTDPLNQMKSALHATAQSLYYGDLGGKQCFAEETGVLGPMVVSDEYAADYIRSALWALLAHDCRGMLWWCGFEQSALTHTPYDWNGVERELGLFRLDKTPKPVLEAIKEFSAFVEKLPFVRLPERLTDAVCILTRGQDVWAAAYGAFLMAKQAKLELTFAWADGPIPEAPAYLLPSLTGDTSFNRGVQVTLLERVSRGAKLYLSLDGALMSPFGQFSGLRVLTRAHDPQNTAVLFKDAKIHLSRQYRLRCESIGAEVLARTEDGEIAFARNLYGAGEVYTLLFPAESQMACQPGMVDSDRAEPAYLLYEALPMKNPCRVVSIGMPYVGLTEHVLDENRRIAVVQNYEPFEQQIPLAFADDWRCAECLGMDGAARWENGVLTLRHNDGAMLMLERA